MRKLTIDAPATKEELLEITSRLSEIESLVNSDCPPDVLQTLIFELTELLEFLEKANRLNAFRSLGLSVVSGGRDEI